jgi:hypothetical protein
VATRKTLSKKLRFEVFKRDGFKCQYCGKSAPEVVLECDHIVPVAEGGKNEMLNLVTACFDCNRGKGKTKLSDNQAVVKQQKQLDELNQRREQTEMMIAWKKELSKLVDAQVTAIEDAIASVTGSYMTDHGRNEVRKLINRFGFEEVFTSSQISFDRYYNDTDYTWDKAFKKIGGICYNRKHGRTWDGD